MTVIAAVVDGDRVRMAADSNCHDPSGMTTPVKKIRTVDTACGPLLIGAAGRLSLLPLGASQGPPPHPDDDLDVWVQSWAETVTAAALERHMVDSDGDMDGGYLLALGGRLWDVDHYNAFPVRTYSAIGSGAAVALGALHATPNRSAKRRVREAVAAAIAHDAGIGGPITTAST